MICNLKSGLSVCQKRQTNGPTREASYELESGMAAATTRARDRLRAVIDAVLPAFDHHANLQLSGEETEEVFDAAVADLGAATMAGSASLLLHTVMLNSLDRGRPTCF